MAEQPDPNTVTAQAARPDRSIDDALGSAGKLRSGRVFSGEISRSRVAAYRLAREASWDGATRRAWSRVGRRRDVPRRRHAVSSRTPPFGIRPTRAAAH